MAEAIWVSRTGDADVIELKRIEPSDPRPGEAWVEQEAVGVNYLDVMQRRGAVPIPLPSGLGLEGAGRVTASYASGRAYPASRLIKLPDGISTADAATILFKGITAQYLIKSTYPVGPGTTILLYGASGGVGQLLVPWAKHLGARVIGVVSKETSVGLAASAGCDEVLVWGACDVPSEVARLTDGRKVNVVYDGVGRETFGASIDSLRVRGMMVSMGASSGLPDPVSIATLNKNSLFLTRPGLAAHATDVEEYRERAHDVLDAVRQDIIKPAISRTFALAEAAHAHRALEQGGVGGSLILTP